MTDYSKRMLQCHAYIRYDWNAKMHICANDLYTKCHVYMIYDWKAKMLIDANDYIQKL